MPRLQVYLPDELYEAVKEHQLPASKMLQDAVRTDLGRRAALDEADRYVAALVERFGEPSAEDYAWADSLSRQVRRAELERGSEPEQGRTSAPRSEGLAAGL